MSRTVQRIFEVAQNKCFQQFHFMTIIIIIIMRRSQSEQHQQQTLKHNFSQQLKNLMHANSNNGTVQKRLILVFMWISFFNSLQYVASNLLYMNPSFHCQGSLQKVTEEYACPIIEKCQIINSETVTAELMLYCDEKMEARVLIQTTSGVGGWFGLIFASLVSDRFGRKLSFSLGLALLSFGTCIIQFIGIIYGSPGLLALSQGASGFCGRAIFFNFLILSTRFLKKEVYEIVSLLWLIVGSTAQITISFLNQLFHSWRILFSLYFGGIVIGLIIVLLTFYEDPIFYFDHGRYQQCKSVFREISIENGESASQIEAKMQQIDKYIEIKIGSNQIEQKQQSKFDIRHILRCDFMTNTLILGILGCFYSMAGWSIDLSIQSLKLNYNQNLFLNGLSKITGFILAIYIIRIEKQRKRGFIFSSIICGIAGMMFAFDFCIKNSWVQSPILFILRIVLCWNGNFYVRLKVDLFPQKYQATLIGLSEFIGNFGKTLCPILTQISIKNNLSPIFTINILHITLGTLPIFLLREQKLKLEDNSACQKEVAN